MSFVSHAKVSKVVSSLYELKARKDSNINRFICPVGCELATTGMMEHIVSIDHDELHSMRSVRSKACEGSSSCNRPAITREERLRNFMEEGDHQARVVEALGTDHPPAKIQKVIFLLQDHKHFVKYFEPRVASVGPIHHGKPKYQLGEKYKLKLAYEFVKGCGKNINVLYELVEKNIKQLRECFEEEVTKKYDDEALAWMLFVDGCAILQYILLCCCSYSRSYYK
jgi:hypothetical protein